MSKRVVVTGATGFIGKHLIRNLLKRDSISIYATTRCMEKAKKIDFFNKVQFLEVDLSATNESIFYSLGSPDILIHLAWEGLPNYHEDFHISKNLIANKKFIKNMLNGGLKDVVVAGTCLEYGMINGCLKEEFYVNPVNSYARAKNLLHQFLENQKLSHEFSLKWLRLFYMYGEGQGKNSILEKIESAVASHQTRFDMSGGEQIRDYLDVEIVADYIAECALQNSINGLINCCSGSPIKLKDFVGKYIKTRGYDIKLNYGVYPYHDYEPMEFWGDNSKIKEIMNNAKK